jgi:hypothetical protein
VLLVNLLIAMMGSTYSNYIEKASFNRVRTLMESRSVLRRRRSGCCSSRVHARLPQLWQLLLQRQAAALWLPLPGLWMELVLQGLLPSATAGACAAAIGPRARLRRQSRRLVVHGASGRRRDIGSDRSAPPTQLSPLPRFAEFLRPVRGE